QRASSEAATAPPRLVAGPLPALCLTGTGCAAPPLDDLRRHHGRPDRRRPHHLPAHRWLPCGDGTLPAPTALAAAPGAADVRGDRGAGGRLYARADRHLRAGGAVRLWVAECLESPGAARAGVSDGGRGCHSPARAT